MNPESPPCHLINIKGIFYFYIFAASKKHDTWGCWFVDALVWHIVVICLFYKFFSRAIYFTHTCDGNIFTFISQNKACISTSRKHFCIYMLYFVFWEILNFFRAYKYRISFYVQFNKAFKKNSS